MSQKKTPERIKAMLATLSPRPRVSAAAIAHVCGQRGPLGTDAERLAARLKDYDRTAKAIKRESKIDSDPVGWKAEK